MHDFVESGNFGVAGVADSGPLRRVWRNAYPFIVVGLLWEAVAHLGIFPVQFFPPLESVGAAFVRLSASGVLPHHAFDTLVRLSVGFALAACAGIAAGGLFWRARPAPAI